MTAPDLQMKLLKKVIDRFQKKSVAVDNLSNLLQVSRDGIYRRLRGDSILTPQEISLLAQTFQLSLDALLFEKTDQILFSYSLFSHPVNSVHDYLEEVNKQARQVVDLKEVRISYATQEIPVFLYYSSPVIFRFKMYIYAHTYWQLAAFRNVPFSFDLIPESTFELARQTSALYNQIPSQEIWRPSLLDNTLNQIQFLVAAGLFVNPRDSLVILDALLELMQKAKAMAENGKKPNPSGQPDHAGAVYQLFFNEYSSTNDTILLESEQQSLLFTSFGMPNFLRTSDDRLLEQIRNWFCGLTTNSASLTQHAAKNRDRLFLQLSKKIQQAREQLVLSIEEMEG